MHESIEAGPGTIWLRWSNIALQVTGAYRVPAWLRGTSFALSARAITPSRLELGPHSAIQRGAILHCGGKAWSGYRGHIRVGSGCVIGPYCVLYGAGGIDLEDHVHLGPGVKLMTQAGVDDVHRHSQRPTFQFHPIRIGAGSWIGTGAAIIGGSRIGRGVSVAPNSVVLGDVPDRAVVAGNPARVLFINEESSDD